MPCPSDRIYVLNEQVNQLLERDARMTSMLIDLDSRPQSYVTREKVILASILSEWDATTHYHAVEKNACVGEVSKEDPYINRTPEHGIWSTNTDIGQDSNAYLANTARVPPSADTHFSMQPFADELLGKTSPASRSDRTMEKGLAAAQQTVRENQLQIREQPLRRMALVLYLQKPKLLAMMMLNPRSRRQRVKRVDLEVLDRWQMFKGFVPAQ